MTSLATVLRGLPVLHGAQLTEDLAAWAAARIAHVGAAGFGPCWACGIVRRKRLAAVVVYHDWQTASGTIQVSCAADTAAWATRDVVRAILSVPFLGLFGAPVRKVWSAMPSNNARAIRFNLGIGFRREAVLRHHFAAGIHAVITSMLREEFARRYPESRTDGKARAVAA